LALGAFYVTPMSYENLFLVSNRTKKHPTFLGPVLISHNLDESCYSHLTFVTTQKSPLLEDNLIAFGTDGEKALYNQFGKKFKSAVHVRCIGHFRENCKTHLKGVSLENQNKSLNDIFGKNIEDMHYGGLIDCESEDIFTATLNYLIDAWHAIVPDRFIAWFQTVIPEILSSMLAPVQEKAGLGKPPLPFYNYRSESINHVIKEGVQYKKQDLPDFILSLQNIISSQIEMIKLAIFRRGNYKFIEDLKYLEIDEDIWLYKMNETQKKNHFAKVMSKIILPRYCARCFTKIT
jgi:hypothetical protein